MTRYWVSIKFLVGINTESAAAAEMVAGGLATDIEENGALKWDDVKEITVMKVSQASREK